MSGHTVAELIVARLAREFTDDTCAFNGAASFIPVAALLLARATHAPRLIWASGSIGVDAQPSAIRESTIAAEMWEGSTMLQSSPHDVWAYANTGRLDTFCFRGVQIDDLGCILPNVFLWSTTHDRRTFVERLDHRSSMGWGDGGEHRARLGLPGGPRLCVTNLAVLDFHAESHRMRLQSAHPGVGVDDVLAATGFELIVDGDVPATAPPTTEELQLIRRLDPTSLRDRG